MLKSALRLLFISMFIASSFPAKAEDPKTNKNLKPEECDFSFTAKVRAKTLRVDAVGNPKVEFHGSENRQVLFDVKRQGFPKPIQTGKTYKNVQVETKILTKFTEPEQTQPKEKQEPADTQKKQ